MMWLGDGWSSTDDPHCQPPFFSLPGWKLPSAPFPGSIIQGHPHGNSDGNLWAEDKKGMRRENN